MTLERHGLAIFVIFVFAIFLMAQGSAFAAEKEVPPSVVRMDMTIDALAAANGVDAATLLKGLKIADNPANRAATIAALGLNETAVKDVVRKAMVLSTEESTKDWRKILLKFVLWWTMVVAGIWLLVKNRVTAKLRNKFLLLSVIVFGVLLGSDPSPMGTVKDAIVLYGAEKTIFPPRIIAFVVFTTMVIVGNKMICGWGCQFGTLQDWLYQISPINKRIKLPFVVSNSIRTAVFIVATIVAFWIPFDLIGAVDPFKIFAPTMIGMVSGAFIFLMLIMSLFIYRPWCTLACPFGLTGWLFERFSWFRVRLNRETCISCGACRRACPSQHMNGLQDGVKHPGDCYSCAACLQICPVGALRYDRK
jgi:polyferredoxin